MGLMATRDLYTSSNPPPITGADYMDNVAGHLKRLLDVAAFPLTSVAGTGDAVTADLDPELDGDGLVEGMLFSIVWGAANTGGVTLAINGGSAVAVVAADGSALEAGALASDLASILRVTDGDLRVMTAVASSGADSVYAHDVFAASGTWSKPSGLADDTPVTVEAWGGGGGGHSSGTGGGGGGGAYAKATFRAADLPSSVAVAVGAGGSAGASGGNSTFGALLTAYGGGGASSANGAGGGGAGGPGGIGGVAGKLGGGAGGTTGDGGGAEASNIWGGGGGGMYSTSAPADRNGGPAVHGGGGGAGSGAGSATAGDSVFGGSGGAVGNAGSAPGGGGGGTAAGARGEVRIWVG